jgi:outer membrane protein
VRARVAALMAVSLLGLVWATSVRAEDLKVAVVEPQKILEGTKSGRQIKDSIEEYVRTRQKLLDSEAEDLRKMEADLAKQGATLSAPVREQQEAIFRQKVALYQRRVQELEGEIQSKKAELLVGFTKTIEQIVKDIAEKEKIALVMDKGNNGDDMLVIFNQPSVDLTDRVIRELDSRKGN